MAYNPSEIQIGVKGNKRYYSGKFSLDGGDSTAVIKTGLSNVEGGSVNYDSGAAPTLPWQWEREPGGDPGDVRVTGDANSRAWFEFWGL